MDTHILTSLGLFFLLCTSDQQKTHTFCRGPSNEHSYPVWFQLVQWFQRRRLKCKSLWIMTTTDNGCQVTAMS